MFISSAEEVEIRLILANTDYGPHRLALNSRTNISPADAGLKTFLTLSTLQLCDDCISPIATVEQQCHENKKGTCTVEVFPRITINRGCEGSVRIATTDKIELFWQLRWPQ